MSENVEEPPEKRQTLAQLENEDQDCLLDAVQAQSTKYNTAYSFHACFYNSIDTKKMFSIS